VDLIAIGTVRTSWGLDGWLKLASHSGEWDHFRSLETVELRRRDGSSGRTFEVEGFRMHHGGGLLKLRGVDSPEAGKALAGMDLLVDRGNAAELADGEWYLCDLVGLDVVTEAGECVGKIIGMVETSDDLLEIEKSGGKSFFVPFRSEFVGEPDIEKGTIVLTATWLEGEV
jgi:16S rRNA processing protein RimM